MGHDDDTEQHSRDRVGGRPPGKPHVGLLRADTETAGGLAYVTCHTHKRASRSNIANRRIKQSLNDTKLAKFAFYKKTNKVNIESEHAK